MSRIYATIFAAGPGLGHRRLPRLGGRRQRPEHHAQAGAGKDRHRRERQRDLAGRRRARSLTPHRVQGLPGSTSDVSPRDGTSRERQNSTPDRRFTPSIGRSCLGRERRAVSRSTTRDARFQHKRPARFSGWKNGHPPAEAGGRRGVRIQCHHRREDLAERKFSGTLSRSSSPFDVEPPRDQVA